jgi:hypothetical protein
VEVVENINYGEMYIPAAELDLVRIFVEKYDMLGVAGFVNFLASSREERRKRLHEIEHLTKVFQKATNIINEAEKLEEIKLCKS